MTTKHYGFATDQGDTVGAAPAPILGVDIFGQPEVLYGTEPGDKNAIAMTDVNQGQIGDCYLLSAIDTFIRKGPQFISNMIHDNGNGTQTVKLYEDATTNAPITLASRYFKPITETVTDATLDQGGAGAVVDSLPTQAIVGGGLQKEIWPQVVEQAYAQLNGGLGNISGGWAAVAMATMSGNSGLSPKAAMGNVGMGDEINPGQFNLSMLQRLINANCTIAFDTWGDGSPLTNGLVGNHSYAYNGCAPNGANTTLNLVNPWGYDNPSPVSLKSVFQDFSSIEIGHAS